MRYSKRKPQAKTVTPRPTLAWRRRKPAHRTTRSNCIIQAVMAYFSLRARGARVVLWMRPSDAEDRFVPHAGWAVYDPARRVYVPWSFRPVNFEPKVPFWRKLGRLYFHGRVVTGDDPAPIALRHGRQDVAGAKNRGTQSEVSTMQVMFSALLSMARIKLASMLYGAGNRLNFDQSAGPIWRPGATKSAGPIWRPGEK
jgi:hypothetical protein